MTSLSATLKGWLAAGRPAVLVEVAEARGSTPREVGARMLVGLESTLGTIGGGRLEWEAIEAAHRLLGEGASDATLELPLGPALGQCCGGHVRLRLEHATASTLVRLEEGERAEAARNPTVLLFGAGHVGKALAQALSPLPLTVQWIDARAEEFPDPLPPGITRIIAVRPVDLVATAPAGAGYLVLTHEHALDFAIASAVLDRGDFAYAGLIGSTTKRRRFERLYGARGRDIRQLARLNCPIGGGRVADKRPAVIAALTAAELLVAFAGYAAQADAAGQRYG